MTEGETRQFWGPGDAGLVPAVPSPGAKPDLAVRTEGWQSEGRVRGEPPVGTEGRFDSLSSGESVHFGATEPTLSPAS